MSHLQVSVNFTADDVHIAHEGDEHPSCHQIEVRPQIGAIASLFGDAGTDASDTDDVRALRDALAKAVVLLDSRLLLLESTAVEQLDEPDTGAYLHPEETQEVLAR
jgi:hypothetical protein